VSASIDKLLFAAASEMSDADERRVFLDHACKDNPDLRKLLDEMLEVRAEAEIFFTAPPEEPDLPEENPQTDDEVLSTQIGRYRLISRIGSGGCGVVYLAEQQAPVRRKVALKIIRLGMDTENVIARFELERQALALMDHPNIARVLDAGATAAGRPYFVMELADGEKITDFCDRKQLGLRERLELFVLVCEAIQHAHQKGIVHRDIKPSNVLVREHDARVVPKVIDFGIAKVTAPELDDDYTATTPGQFIGTPAYMSPEQAEGSVDIDTRSDIYSLGALLCELLMGSPPLKPEDLHGHGVEEIRRMLREGRNRAPSIRLKTVPITELEEIAKRRSIEPSRLGSAIAGDLDWIVMKATETERQRRYETANGLAMDVQRHLNDEPVLARPPSRWYLLTKAVRRNRVAFVAGGAALLALLAGLGLSTWLFLQERNARHEQARLRIIAEQATANEVRLREDAKVGDQVRQAAVFLRYNDAAQADKLLDGLPAEKIPRSLEAADTFMAVANWNLRQERWKTAAQRFNTLGRVLTSVDMRDSERISFDFLSVATAVCLWGEPGEYDELRKLAITRFGNSANPTVAEHVLKATLLRPADQPTLEKLLPLAYVLESSLSRMDRTPHMMAWQKFSLALFAYRRGDLDTSAELAGSSLSLASNSAPRSVSDRLLLVMIDMRRGKTVGTRDTVAELRREVDSWLKGPFQLVNADNTLWYNQYAVLVLLTEAEGMLKLP
jgi:serine/threonine protein kinase